MSDWETGRLEALSDGVLAIAVTLLVLDSRLPDELEPGHLGAALRDLGGSYAAYALSFLVIGIMWANHHAMFRLIAAVDEGSMFVNVILLGAIAFLPFPTAVLARSLRTGNDADQVSALLLYGVTSALIAVGYNLLWHYARLRGLAAAGARPGSRQRGHPGLRDRDCGLCPGPRAGVRERRPVNAGVGRARRLFPTGQPMAGAGLLILSRGGSPCPRRLAAAA